MNPTKFPDVTSDHNQIVGQGNSRDLKIERPDYRALLFKSMTNCRVCVCTRIIKGERWIQRENFLNHGPALSRIIIFSGSIKQLRAHRSTAGYFGSFRPHKAIYQPQISGLQNFNPDITVQKISHYHVLAGGSGKSSGISNSRSARLPMMSARSGRLRFISSIVGNGFSSTTSEITSRTRDSSTRAFSGARRSRVRSSSNAIVNTSETCHGESKNSTSNFPLP